MDKRIVEVNGIKIEVDLRSAKTVDSYKVGDNVKVLIKSYGDTYNVYPGVVISFDEFPSLPTIVVAYLSGDYSSRGIKFATLNAKTDGVEIAPMHEHEILFEKATVLEIFDADIRKKEQERLDIEMKRNYFLEHFNKHFEKSVEA